MWCTGHCWPAKCSQSCEGSDWQTSLRSGRKADAAKCRIRGIRALDSCPAIDIQAGFDTTVLASSSHVSDIPLERWDQRRRWRCKIVFPQPNEWSGKDRQSDLHHSTDHRTTASVSSGVWAVSCKGNHRTTNHSIPCIYSAAQQYKSHDPHMLQQ